MATGPVPVRHLEDPGAIEAACATWCDVPELGIDTEFERTRTFYARPALVQVRTPQAVILVDPLAIGDLSTMAGPLAAAGVVKILHACGEDLELLARLTGALPSPLFDTQVAAALLGWGLSTGYRTLVRDLLGVEIEKGETRSDWLRRPLSPAQIHYAAVDVEHLPALHRLLREQLAERGRLDWASEEFTRLAENAIRQTDPQRAWLRVPGAPELDPQGRAVLRALAAWREAQARSRDAARRFVLADPVLLEIARRRPASLRELASIPGLAREPRPVLATLLEQVAQALALPEDAWPEPAVQWQSLKPWQGLLDSLKARVRQRAEALGVVPEVLAQRRVLEALVRDVVVLGRADPPRELLGWRREVIGEELLGLVREHAGDG